MTMVGEPDQKTQRKGSPAALDALLAEIDQVLADDDRARGIDPADEDG